MPHLDWHEEIILNHIDGNLDEVNLNEALSLLRGCKECKEIYEKSLFLKSKLQRTSILDVLRDRKVEMHSWARSESKPWKAFSWRTLSAVALVSLGLAIPFSVYIRQLQKEVRDTKEILRTEREKGVSDLSKVKSDYEQLKAKVQALETQSAASVSLAAAAPMQKSFLHPYLFALPLAEIRGPESVPPEKAVEIVFPKNADLLHLIFSFAEENAHSRYNVVVWDGKGRLVLRDDDVKKDSVGNFNLYFRREFFESRSYLLKVFASDAGTPQLLAQQRMRVSFARAANGAPPRTAPEPAPK